MSIKSLDQVLVVNLPYIQTRIACKDGISSCSLQSLVFAIDVFCLSVNNWMGLSVQYAFIESVTLRYDVDY